MSEARWDVLGFGALAVDDLVYLDGYPAPDTKMQIKEEARQGGGLTGTALVAVTRLGGTAAYCGGLDVDSLSQDAVAGLEREGVDCSRVVRREGARPTHATVIVDRGTGQRCILFSRAGVMPPAAEDLPESLIADCRVLFVDSSTVESDLYAIALAKRHGIPSVADIEHPDAPHVDELIAAVDHLIVGVELAGRVTGAKEPVEMVRAWPGPTGRPRWSLPVTAAAGTPRETGPSITCRHSRCRPWTPPAAATCFTGPTPPASLRASRWPRPFVWRRPPRRSRPPGQGAGPASPPARWWTPLWRRTVCSPPA
jgi:hypothetical protein